MHDAEPVLREIEEKAKWEFLPIIGPDKGKFLEDLIREKRPCRAVEIGVLVGYATILIGRSLPNGCRLWGIEISEEMADRARLNVTAAGLSETVTILRGDARERLDEVEGPIDFVFMDGQKSQYLSHLRMLEAKLSPEAVVVANGTGQFAKELKDYLEYVRESADFRTDSQVFGNDSMEVSTFVRKRQ